MAKGQRCREHKVLTTVFAVRVDCGDSPRGTELYKSAIMDGWKLPPLSACARIEGVTFYCTEVSPKVTKRGSSLQNAHERKQPGRRAAGKQKQEQVVSLSDSPKFPRQFNDCIITLHCDADLGKPGCGKKRAYWLSVELPDHSFFRSITLSQREAIAIQAIMEEARQYRDVEITEYNRDLIRCKGETLGKRLDAAKIAVEGHFAYHEVTNVMDNIKKKLRKAGLGCLLPGAYGPGWYFNTHPRNLNIMGAPDRLAHPPDDP